MASPWFPFTLHQFRQKHPLATPSLSSSPWICSKHHLQSKTLENGGRKAMKEDPLLQATSLSIWHLSSYKEKFRVYSRLISALSIWAKRSPSTRGSPPPHYPYATATEFCSWKVAANVWRHGPQDPHSIIFHIKFQRAYFPCLNTQDTHLFNSLFILKIRIYNWN